MLPSQAIGTLAHLAAHPGGAQALLAPRGAREALSRLAGCSHEDVAGAAIMVTAVASSCGSKAVRTALAREPGLLDALLRGLDSSNTQVSRAGKGGMLKTWLSACVGVCLALWTWGSKAGGGKGQGRCGGGAGELTLALRRGGMRAEGPCSWP